MKNPQLYRIALRCAGAWLLAVAGLAAQADPRFELWNLGWDDGPRIVGQAVTGTTAVASEGSTGTAPLRVILTRAGALAALTPAVGQELRQLAMEGVPVICRGSDRELAAWLGCQVLDVTDAARRDGELAVIRRCDGQWLRAYFVPWEAMEDGVAEGLDPLLDKALAWISLRGPLTVGSPASSVPPQGPPRPLDDSVGTGWNGMERLEWHGTVTYGSSVLGDYWVTLTAHKLRDTRPESDWYLVENMIEHAEVRAYVCTAAQHGWYVTTHQLSVQTLDQVTSLEEHGPGTTQGQQSVSYTIGGELGMSLEGPAAGLNTSFSQSYDIPDVTIQNRSDRGVPEARWDCRYGAVGFRDYPFCDWPSCPPGTSHFTHATKQASIWKTPVDARGVSAIPFRVFTYLHYAVETVDPWIFGCGYHTLDAQDLNARDITISRNFPPATPSKPSLPSPVQVGQAVEAATSGVDPDGNAVQFMFDWGDSVGEYGEASQSHVYLQAGTYGVRARAVDICGEESGWSESFAITVTGTAPAAPVITACSVPSTGVFQLQGHAAAGMTFTIQTSTNLFDWTSAQTLVAGAEGSIQYSGPAASTGPACYYRLRWP